MGSEIRRFPRKTYAKLIPNPNMTPITMETKKEREISDKKWKLAKITQLVGRCLNRSYLEYAVVISYSERK